MIQTIDVKPSDYIFTWTSGNYSANMVSIIPEAELLDYFKETFGFDLDDIETISNMESCDIWQEVNGLIIVKV